MHDKIRKASWLLLIGNTLLFILKLAAGILSNSIAIISDAINSLTDIIASVVVFVSVRIAGKKADKTHPFGHHRVEPTAGLIVAIFIGIVGFEVLRAAIERLIMGGEVTFGYFAIAVLLFTMVFKTIMALYLKHVSGKFKSPAIHASYIDCRNDVVISFTALIGIIGVPLNLPKLDAIAGIIIGIWILFSAYKVGRSNIDYLIGSSPDKRLIEKIKTKALKIRGVKGLNDVKAHYVGHYVHVEVHIELDKKIVIKKAHDIGKQVEYAVEALPEITRAFIHIDPV